MKSVRKIMFGPAFPVLVTWLFVSTLTAQTTWDGGGTDNLLSNATNWSGDVAPAATGGQLVFAGSVNLNPSNNSYIQTLATTTGHTAFTFASGAGAFNISGTIITNGVAAGNTVLVDQNSAANQTISADLKFNANQRDRNIRFASGSGSVTLAGNVNFGSDIIALGVTANSGTNGTLILTGTNSGDGKGSQIQAGGNQLRAALWTAQDNSRLVLGSDSALGNAGAGSVASSNAVFKGLLAGKVLYISTTNGSRNLSGSSIGITGTRVEFDGADNLTIGNVINSGGNRDLWVSGAGTLTVSSGLFLSESATVGRTNFFNVTNFGNAVVSGSIYDTFNSVSTLANVSTLRKAGNGTLALNGDSSATFNGTVQIEGGTLRLGHVGALGSTNSTAFTSIRAATLDLNGLSIGEKLWTDNAAAVIANSSATAAAVTQDIGLSSDVAFTNIGEVTVQRVIATAVRTVTKSGAGTLTSAGTNHNNLTAWVINGGTVNFANTAGYGADRGVTINSGGTLMLSGANSDLINNAQTFTINTGGTFNLNGKSEAVASIEGTGGTVLNNAVGAATLYVGGGSSGTNSASWAGVIQNGSGTLRLVKEGTGTQTLTGSNTYTGSTTVTNGTLVIVRTNLTATITPTNVALSFSNAPQLGTYKFLPGSLAGSYSTNVTVDPLSPGQSATLDATNGAVVIALASQPLPSVNFTPPSDLTYNGSPKTYAADAGGPTLTLNYTGRSLTVFPESTNAPTRVGDYTVTATADGYTGQQSTDFSITAKGLTVTGASVTSKTFDGNTTASITGATLSGVVAGDDVTLTGENSGEFTSQNVGIGIAVTTSMGLTGADSSNYTLTQPTLTGNITAAGPTFEDAYQGKALSDLAPNGLRYLMNYALGGSDSLETKLPWMDTSDPTKLTLVAYVRTNDPTVTVTGEAGTNLTNWSSSAITTTSMTDPNAPAGTEKRSYSVLVGTNQAQFLRLKATK